MVVRHGIINDLPETRARMHIPRSLSLSPSFSGCPLIFIPSLNLVNSRARLHRRSSGAAAKGSAGVNYVYVFRASRHRSRTTQKHSTIVRLTRRRCRWRSPLNRTATSDLSFSSRSRAARPSSFLQMSLANPLSVSPGDRESTSHNSSRVSTLVYYDISRAPTSA